MSDGSLRTASQIVWRVLVLVLLSASSLRTLGFDQIGPVSEEDRERLGVLGYIDDSATVFDRDGVVTHDELRSQPGVNLVVSSHASEAMLMDMAGDIHHRWWIDEERLADTPVPSHMPAPWPPFWRKVLALDGGGLLAIHEGYGVVCLERDSTVRWIRTNGAHHDLWQTDSGRFFVLARELVSIAGVGDDGPVLDDRVLEMDTDGSTIGSWSILEGLLSSKMSELVDTSHGPRGDPLHCNSLQIVDDVTEVAKLDILAGDFIVSCRHIDAVLALRPSTRMVTWVLTGLASNQHDARLGKGGRLTLFDNADADARSRGLIIDLETSSIVRSVPERRGGGLFSRCCGTVQMLPNGNLLTTFTEASVTVETDPEGVVVWEFRSPHRSVAPNRESDDDRAMLYQVERIVE